MWLWTKPAGNVHLPATPLFLRVGMLSSIQTVFLNRESVAGTHWFIHPKNQHLQQKSIKIPSSSHKCAKRCFWMPLGFPLASPSWRFQQEGPQQDSPLNHPKVLYAMCITCSFYMSFSFWQTCVCNPPKNSGYYADWPWKLGSRADEELVRNWPRSKVAAQKSFQSGTNLRCSLLVWFSLCM